jgi:hypothetical protein
MKHSMRCGCGTIRGEVETGRSAGRAVCYCRDCQDYARFLGSPVPVLDAQGGTEIVATVPRHLRFTAGADRLACMSLSEGGLLRWYAGCCRTPLGNTPRDRKVSYVGLVRACLPGTDAALDASFGPLSMTLNTASALGPVKKTPVAMAFAMVKILRNVVGSRLGGTYRDNPFFTPSGAPVVVPVALSTAEREALRRTAPGA